jgi:hypothetical protein
LVGGGEIKLKKKSSIFIINVKITQRFFFIHFISISQDYCYHYYYYLFYSISSSGQEAAAAAAAGNTIPPPHRWGKTSLPNHSPLANHLKKKKKLALWSWGQKLKRTSF